MTVTYSRAGNDFGQWRMDFVWVERNRSPPRDTYPECFNLFDMHGSIIIGL